MLPYQQPFAGDVVIGTAPTLMQEKGGERSEKLKPLRKRAREDFEGDSIGSEVGHSSGVSNCTTMTSQTKTTWSHLAIRPLYLLLSGFARGQALGCHVVARASIACRKLKFAETLQRHARKTISLSFWIVGFQFQLFLQTIGLDAATSSPLTGLRSIVLPLELNVRVRLRRRSSLPSQTLVLPLQLPSRKARQVREELAEAGKQIEEHKKREEEMERLLASSIVRMPAQKLRSRIFSFENVKGNDD